MNVYVNKITGIEDAIVSMYISKRNWSREFEEKVHSVCKYILNDRGGLPPATAESVEELLLLNQWIEKLAKWGWQHTTLLRFIDISVTVEGLHRAGQDDWDSHSMRFNNRIIRSSTRLSSFSYELSEWYKGKIIPTDMALEALNIDCPVEIDIDGTTYVRAVNGYVQKEYANSSDVKRGLYMLSIPSTFIFKVNLTEWAHVYKERNKQGGAHPEVKQCCEAIADQIEELIPAFNRELFDKIRN